MAKFRITDNQSGKTLVISGDSPPSEQEAEQLFQQSGIRNQQAEQQPQGNGIINALGSVAKTLNPNVVQYAQENLQKIGEGNLTPTSGIKNAALIGGPIANILFGTPHQGMAGVELASDIQGAKGIASAAQGGITNVGNIARGVAGTKSISPVKIAGFLRQEAADKAGKLTTDSLITAGDKYAKMNPFAKEAWDTLKPTIKSSMPASDLLDRMSSVFGQAYTKSGDVRSTAEAALMNKLYQAGKNVMMEQAPEVAKYTGGLRQILSAPQQAQRLTWLALKMAGLGRLVGL